MLMKEVYHGTERNAKSYALYHCRCILRYFNTQLFHFHQTEKGTEKREESHGVPEGEPVCEAGSSLPEHCHCSASNSPVAVITEIEKERS